LVSIILSIPSRCERISADREVVQLRVLMQDPHDFAGLIIDPKADRAIHWRRNETDSDASRRRG
jgi:hypothetical protein